MGSSNPDSGDSLALERAAGAGDVTAPAAASTADETAPALPASEFPALNEFGLMYIPESCVSFRVSPPPWEKRVCADFYHGHGYGNRQDADHGVAGAGLRARGISCCPVKPLGAGGVMAEGRRISEDAIVYRTLGGMGEPLALLNPRCLERPASPHFAAELERIALAPGDLLAPLRVLAERYDYLLVEGIGGWLVPVTYDYSVAAIARDLGLPVLVVSANRLGTLNHTLLTLNRSAGGV